MSANNHLQPQLDAYAKLTNPGFALLIDAPWGAGKTYTLQGWLSGRNDAIYVSVYGAKNPGDIEEALFQNTLERRDIKPPQGATKILEGVAEKFTGARIDLTGAFRRSVLKDLPKVLVFDDLERTEMPMPELFGAINRFVEHEGRNVILLANQAELRSKDVKNYERTKEKIIGRVVTIYPNVEAALEGFLHTMENSKEQFSAHALLANEKGLLSSVFTTSQTLNLRLLRYAMLEFARVFDRLPVDLRDNKEGMRYLLATFVALSISFHGGEGLAVEGLSQERGWAHAIWQVSGQKGEAPPKSPIERLQERYGEHPFVQLHGQVISAELAVAWIAKGHVADDFLTSELRKSSVFRTKDPEAWQTLWWWVKRPEAEVATAIATVKKQLSDNRFRDPVVIMHLFGIMLTLADNSIGWESRNTAEQEMRAYLVAVEREKLLPTDLPKRLWGGVRFDTGALGLGFHQNESREFHAIRKELIEALDRSFWRENPTRVEDLLSTVQSNVEDFSEIINNHGRRNGLPNYAHEPIFADADPDKTARMFFSLENATMHDVLHAFKERVPRLERDSALEGIYNRSEMKWLLQVRTIGLELASKSSPIRAAQIRKAIEWQLDFLDKNDENSDSSGG